MYKMYGYTNKLYLLIINNILKNKFQIYNMFSCKHAVIKCKYMQIIRYKQILFMSKNIPYLRFGSKYFFIYMQTKAI